ncbi:hypothetical protein [Anaerosporobacter sp.]|uniref:hypothetical protein n=1 Tax=Anaerosporobacter sp. TaxID=1872529 RepID=UPI00286ED2E4|nr:hypothetical protein [Anaerosporobacter sp.]
MNFCLCDVVQCKFNLHHYCNNQNAPQISFEVEGGKRTEFGKAVCTAFENKGDK